MGECREVGRWICGLLNSWVSRSVGGLMGEGSEWVVVLYVTQQLF